MRKYYFITIIFLSLSSQLTAQNYFPSHIGNKWQYEIDYYSTGGPGGGGSGTKYGKISIVSDSILYGKLFIKLDSYKAYFFHSTASDDFLFHYDTTQQKLFVKLPEDDTLRLAVDFNIPADSPFVSYINGYPRTFISNGVFTDTVFNKEIITFQMTYDNSVIQQIFRFGDEFGIVYYYFHWTEGVNGGYNEAQLYSTILDSLAYNPLFLEITSISPLEDRPINDFPFILSGSFDASVPALVDSFYVDVIHTRWDSVLHSFRMGFDDDEIEIPYMVDLQVGDVIHLRATATDESIFENIAHYPDTGYAIINVLQSVTNIISENIVEVFNLSQNYPNPFNPSTTIRYEIPERSFVTLIIYDVLGNEIAILVNEEKPIGSYEVEFYSKDLPSGIYFYRLQPGSFVETKKMVLLR